jgi:hypothetical protein
VGRCQSRTTPSRLRLPPVAPRFPHFGSFCVGGVGGSQPTGSHGSAGRRQEPSVLRRPRETVWWSSKEELLCAVQPSRRLPAAKYCKFSKIEEKSSKSAKVLDFSESEDRFQLLLGSHTPRGMTGAAQGRAAVSRTMANYCKPLGTTSDTQKKQRKRIAGPKVCQYLEIEQNSRKIIQTSKNLQICNF